MLHFCCYSVTLMLKHFICPYSETVVEVSVLAEGTLTTLWIVDNSSTN